jgi:hypothetical protein
MGHNKMLKRRRQRQRQRKALARDAKRADKAKSAAK